jgi:hypothetical protein
VREHHGSESQLPSDGGLAGLGLLMQLGAALHAGVMVLYLTDYFVADSPRIASSHMPTVAVLGILRSWFHFSGARSLLYSDDRTNLSRSVVIYLGVAVAHTAAAVYLMYDVVPRPADVAALGVLLLAWPVTLFVLLFVPRFRTYASGVPVPDDSSFEGVSLIMLVLGLAGALWASMMFAHILDVFPLSSLTSSELGAGLFVVHAALLTRGIFHVLTGHAGAFGGTPTAINAAAARYYNVGIATALGAGAILFVISLDGHFGGYELFRLVFLVYALLAWPVLLRWFFGVRGISTIGATDEEHPHRAPDRGLASLGWLLLAIAVFTLAISIPRVLWDAGDYTAEIATFGALTGGDIAAMFGRSSLLSVAVGALQLWAGLELISMSSRRRVAATIYGVVGGAITIYAMLPFLRNWNEFIGSMSNYGSDTHLVVLSYSQLALALVVPLATVGLVARRRTPHAKARFVTGEDER